MLAFFDDVLTGLVYLLCSLVLFFLAKVCYSLFHPQRNLRQGLFGDDNFALALSVVGYYAGVIAAIVGVLLGSSRSTLIDSLAILFYGVFAIILLNLSLLFCDRFILGTFSNSKEIVQDKNVGVGAVEGGVVVAIGLALGTIFSLNPVLPYLWMLGFVTLLWLISLLTLMLAAGLYELILPYKLLPQLAADNAAVGVAFAGLLVAVGILLRAGFMAGLGILGSTSAYAFAFVLLGILLMPAVRWVTDLLLVPGATFESEIAQQERPNAGAALLEAFVYVAAALLISFAF